MSRYYDQQGNPMSFAEWAQAFEAARMPQDGKHGRHIGYDEEHEHLISTVWLGFDYNWGDGPPLIFETMIFCHHESHCDLNEAQWRYSTEDEARTGHQAARRLVAESQWPSHT